MCRLATRLAKQRCSARRARRKSAGSSTARSWMCANIAQTYRSASLRRPSFVRSIFLRAITAGLYPNDAALTSGIADVRRQIVDATQGAPKYSRRVRLSTASGSVGHERNRLIRCFVG